MRPLEVLEIFGQGGIGNEAVFTPSNPRYANDFPSLRLHTVQLKINLLEDGVFGTGTTLLHVDMANVTDLGGYTTNRDAAGITTYNPQSGGGAIMGFSLAVTDELGNPGVLAKAQPFGETFTLVDKISLPASALALQRKEFDREHKLQLGPYIDMLLHTYLDEPNGISDLSLKGTWVGTDGERSKPLLEGMLANSIALQNAGDLLAGSGISNALQVTDPRRNRRGLGIFTTLGGQVQRVFTGSHVDYEGFGFVGGPVWSRETPLGSVLFGAFIEGGRGDYETSNEFKVLDERGKPTGLNHVLGDGASDYLGGGVLVRHDFDPGYYVEASARAGRVTNEFSSSDMGPRVGYRTEGGYLGLHGGLGYRFEYLPGLIMDVYGRVHWTRIEGDEVATFDGEPLVFHDSKYLRTTLGVRYSYLMADTVNITAGGGWNYNFGGRYGAWTGAVTGYRTPIARGAEPSLIGSNGFLELGLEYKPSNGSGFSMSLSGRAHLGQVLGQSGMLTLNYLFGGPDGPSDTAAAGHPPSAGTAAPGVPAVRAAGAPAGEGDAGSRPLLVAQASRQGADGPGSDPGALETVTVYAEPDWKQLLSPGTVSVVVPENYKGEQKSVGELLESVPGLHVKTRGGSGQYTTVNVRGSTSAQVGLYIDGVPQNLGGDAAADLSLYTSENVARIEVYKGYIPVRFRGAPIGGVINIVTRKPQGQNTTLSVGARSFGGFQANGLFSGPLLAGTLLLSASRDQSDGDFPYRYWQAGYRPGDLFGNISDREKVAELMRQDRRRRKNNSHQKTDVMAKWQNEHFSIQAAWKEMDRYYPSTTQSDSYFGGQSPYIDLTDDAWDPVSRRHRQQVLERDLTVGYRNDWGDLNWGVLADFKEQVQDFRWVDGRVVLDSAPRSGELWTHYETRRWGVTVDAAYKIGERNMLEFTGSLTRESLYMIGNDWEDAQLTYHFQMQNDYEQDSLHLQLQDTITMGDDVWLTLIGRGYRVTSSGVDITRWSPNYGQPTPDTYTGHNFNTDGGKFNMTWGVALKKNVGDNWSFKATGGTFIRYPNFYELFGDGIYLRPALYEANNVPLPLPEEGEQWDFTVEWRGKLPWLDTQANFSATYFTRRTENMIGLFQTLKYVYYGNYGDNRASGVEFEGGIKSALADLSFSGTWLESEVITGPEIGPSSMMNLQYAEEHEILNTPRWETNLRLDVRIPPVRGLSVFAEHHFTDKVPIQYLYNGSIRYEEALHRINLGFKAQLPGGFSLTAGVDDVLDAAPRQGFIDAMSTAEWARGRTSTLYFPKPGRTYYGTIEVNF
jgi:outer membrane cobalamin receptor